MRRPARYVGTSVVLVLLAGSAALTLARVLGSDGFWWVLLAALVPWATLGYLASLLLLGLLLWRLPWGPARTAVLVLASVSLLGFGAHVAWLAPAYLGPHAHGRADLTVLELNLRLGQADAGQLAALVEEEGPDLVVLAETTPDALADLEATGAVGPGSPLPHRGGRALPGKAGTVVLSRYALSRQTRLAVPTGAYLMRVHAPRPFWLTAFHADQPLVDVGRWRDDLARLARSQQGLEGPRMVVGDFNATLDHSRLRRVLGTGLHDAAQEANSGPEPTWPAPRWMRVLWVRPPFGLVSIDHVLLSPGFSAISTGTRKVADTDHLAVVARLSGR